MDNILALVVIPGQIWLAFLQKIVNAVLISRSYRVEDRRLPIVVHMVRVPTFFDQHLHDIAVALSGGVENWRLAIAVDMVGLATMLQEKPAKVLPTVTRNVKETGLVQGVLERRVAFCFFYKVFRHFKSLFVIFNQARGEQGILGIVGLVLQIRDVIWLDKA